jgi:hypothetical protein
MSPASSRLVSVDKRVKFTVDTPREPLPADTSAAVCRGMPFCPCYSRVDLRPSPGLVLLLCWRENPAQPGTSAPAGGSRRFQPDGDSCRNAAHWRPRRRRPTRTLSKHQRAQQARPSFTPAQAGPAATHAVPAAHHSAGGSSHPETRSTTTHSNEKCLLSISKPRRSLQRTPNTSATCRVARWRAVSTDRPDLHAPDNARWPATGRVGCLLCSSITGD